MFDVPLAEKATTTIRAEVPDVNNDWQIGLIVGPSGSGKTTLARHVFGQHVYQNRDWPTDCAVIDCIDNEQGCVVDSKHRLPIRQITGLLTAVGFSSPPSWIKPYHILSNGEQFRCNLAKALCGIVSGVNPSPSGRGQGEGARDAEERLPPCAPLTPVSRAQLLVFDEFTSVVDRNVARIASAAVAKAIRTGQIATRFVAVTCHYDVIDWLAPDWVIDMSTGRLDRRSLRRRPAIDLSLYRCQHAAWTLFARHHYLNGSLSKAARCFIALWEGNPVVFCATLPLIGRRNHWRITRLVTQPDYQGVGLGMRVAAAVAELHREQGHRLNVTASHPALIAHCRKSRRWRTARVMKTGSRRAGDRIHSYSSTLGRAMVSFEYVGCSASETLFLGERVG